MKCYRETPYASKTLKRIAMRSGFYPDFESTYCNDKGDGFDSFWENEPILISRNFIILR